MEEVYYKYDSSRYSSHRNEHTEDAKLSAKYNTDVTAIVQAAFNYVNHELTGNSSWSGKKLVLRDDADRSFAERELQSTNDDYVDLCKDASSAAKEKYCSDIANYNAKFGDRYPPIQLPEPPWSCSAENPKLEQEEPVRTATNPNTNGKSSSAIGGGLSGGSAGAAPGGSGSTKNIGKPALQAGNSNSKLFVSTTKPPPNLAPDTQESDPEQSVKEVAKLSKTKKKQLEQGSGVSIDSDKSLEVAKKHILAGSTAKSVTVTGGDNPIFSSGDPGVDSELGIIQEKIMAIETSRDDCPDWGIDGCHLPSLPGLGKLKGKLAYLQDKVSGAANWAKAQGEALLGKLPLDKFKSMIKCVTHLTKKGIAGVAQVSKYGHLASGVKNFKFTSEFTKDLAENGGLKTAMPDLSGSMRSSLGNATNAAGDEFGGDPEDEGLQVADMKDLFVAIQSSDEGVDFKPNKLTSPFTEEGEPTVDQDRSYDYSDAKYFEDLCGAVRSDSPEVLPMSNDERAKYNKLTFALDYEAVDDPELEEKSPSIMMMNHRANAVANSGYSGQHSPFDTTARTDVDNATLMASTASGKSTHEIKSSVASGELKTLVQEREDSLELMEEMNSGNFKNIDDSKPLLTEERFITQTSSQVVQNKKLHAKGDVDVVGRTVDNPVKAQFRRDYDEIMRGYA